MRPPNYARLFLAAFIMGVTFLCVEFVVEGAAKMAFGISETDYLNGITLTLSGARYYVINFLNFYSFCCLVMWLYASLLPKYGTFKRSVLASTISILALTLFATTNLVNIGLIPFKAGLTSLVFNVIELIPAIIAGASVYSGGRDSE